MVDPYWTCPVCDFHAANEPQRQQHLKDNADDPAHAEHLRQIERKP